MSFANVKVVILGVDEFTKTLKRPMRALKKFGQGAKTAGTAMTLGLTMPIAAFDISLLKVAGNFEAAMNKVQNLTGATGKQLDSLKVKARQLGKTTPFKATDAANAMGVLGLAGQSTVEILKSITPAMSMAGAGNILMAESSEILTGALAGYNLNAKKSGFVTDLFVKAMQSTKTDITGIGEAFSFVSPMARSAGVKITDTALAVGLLSNANIKGKRAGTTFRAMLASLAKPSNEAAKTLERLKIPRNAIWDDNNKFTSLPKMIKAFKNSGAEMKDTIAIFGRKMGIGMDAMMAIDDSKIKELIKMFADVKGTAKKAADINLKGLNGSIKRLVSAFQELQLTMADSGILDKITQLIIKISDVIRKVSKASPKFFKFAFGLSLVVAVLGPLLFAVGQLAVVFSVVGGAIAAAGGLLAFLGGIVGAVVSPFILMAALIGIVGFNLNNKFGKTLGVLLLVLAPFGFLLAYIISRFKKILPFVKLIGLGFVFLGGILKPFITTIFTPFAEAIEILVDMLDGLLDGLTKLANLVLPDWVKKKIGIDTNMTFDSNEITGVNDPTQLQNFIKGLNGETTVKFANAPEGLQVVSASGNINVKLDTGELLGSGASGGW